METMRNSIVYFAVLAGFVTIQASASPAQTNTVYVSGGLVRSADTDDPSYSWQCEYIRRLGEHFEFSVSYLNEGHLPNHHRDGLAGQLWAGTSILDRRLFLSAGIGPYLYSDTTDKSGDSPYINEHGLGFEGSVAATWNMGDRWLLRLRANWIGGADSETVSVLLGIGYDLDSESLPGSQGELTPGPGEKTRNEITAFAGQTIVNSFSSEPSLAMGIEYRRNLLRCVDWTIGWLSEGENERIDRDGIISQFWLTKRFFSDYACLGLGGGAYLAFDDYHGQLREGEGNEALSGIITLTGSYRFLPSLGVRISWSRIIADYNRDTDVIMLGIGYHY